MTLYCHEICDLIYALLKNVDLYLKIKLIWGGGMLKWVIFLYYGFVHSHIRGCISFFPCRSLMK